MQRHSVFSQLARKVARLSGRPASFAIACAVIVLWALSGQIFHFNDTWQLVINTGTTIVTFLMVFLVQNSQNRDASAMQAKLDELIRAMVEAKNEYIGIEHLTEEEIEVIRRRIEEECGASLANTPHAALHRFQHRQ